MAYIVECVFLISIQLLPISLDGKNIKINWLYEKCLRIVYNDKKSTFFEKDNLALALYKAMIPQNRQNRYDKRNNADFTLPLVKSVRKGFESLGYLGPKICEILPVYIKKLNLC